jgi:hypothetical protein
MAVADRSGHSQTPSPASPGGSSSALVPRAFPGAGAGPSIKTGGNTTNQTCAVPRLDVHHQIVQPSSGQIDWAIQMATRGLLTHSRRGDPSWNLAAYTPSSDFPFSVTVPREVMSGVIAAESNWDQASFHAAVGVAGDPLIANYYGVSADGSSRDYNNADCGYGLTQQTDGMRIGDTLFSANTQQAVGLDYAENVAAGMWTLVGKWNQLASLGIVANNGSATYLENWYFALWAYNTGIHPDDGTGQSGLGWSNNPINPIYPANRAPYLRTSYADAATPNNWPYQEQVIGWMEHPLLAGGNVEYAPSSQYLLLPSHTQFCNTNNSCNPSNTTSPCSRSDLHCWWHWAASWGSGCANSCTAGQWSLPTNASEPATPANPTPPACNVSGIPVPSTSAVIVDEEADGNPNDLHVSLNSGCTGSRNWQNNGTFSLAYGSMGMVDFHQLGVGFDGHTWFSHEVAASDAAHTATGTWKPTLPRSGNYMVYVFVPSAAATATDAQYTIHNGSGGTIPVPTVLNQNLFANAWVPVGSFNLTNGATLQLSNNTTASLHDMAFDAVAFDPISSPVLFIHGSPGSSGSGGGDDGTDWNDLRGFLSSRGLSPLTEGFYAADVNMDDYIDYSGNAMSCYGQTYYGSGNDGQSTAPNGRSSHNVNADLRHLAYQLAWRIHDLYGTLNVRIVADSMGGLIPRWMLYQLHNPESQCPYPSALNISDAITVATPHDGAPNAQFGCAVGQRENCEIQYYTTQSDNPFLWTLNNSSTGLDPQASAGTDWTVVGSYGDGVITQDSATFMGSSSGFVHKVKYLSTPGCSGCTGTYNGKLTYNHGQYIHDLLTTLDAGLYRSDRQPDNWINQSGQPHAALEIYYALTTSTY